MTSATERAAAVVPGVPKPTRGQVNRARAVTAWYLSSYYGTSDDVGLPLMFCRADRVGHFAVDAAALASGEAHALFRLLVTMTMFQRRSDLQIMRVLQGIPEADARAMTDAGELLRLADAGPCELARDLQDIIGRCDLAKTPDTKLGTCGVRPAEPCYLKRHTELLKRYGHFGKVPTSAALMLRTHGATDLAQLKRRIWAETASPYQRATTLEAAISNSWRVSEKISAMFLSAVTNRDLSGDLAPWAEGVDSSHFVVIDSNVDLFLKAIKYDGPMTYRARRAFIQSLASRVRLDELDGDLQRYNPRLVQQALYMFMSESNRRASEGDCSNASPSTCATCPSTLTTLCPRRHMESPGASA